MQSYQICQDELPELTLVTQGVTILVMIKTFGDKETQRVFEREPVRKAFAGIQRVALRKLTIIHAAQTLTDLKVPPGNRLESLKGDRAGQHSIRVNDQYRICFRWENGNAYHVEITDYH